MNFIKRIFTCRNNASSNEEDIKTLSDEDVRIVVPEPEIVDGNIPTIEDKHNAFNVVKKNNETGLYFRLMSEKSNEIMRMNCTGYTYEFNDLRYLMSPEAKKNRFDYNMPYVKKEERWHFIARLYVTSKDNFFYQFIRDDSSCGYVQVDRQWVQGLVQKCESESLAKIFYENRDNTYRYVSKPGTYTLENFNRDVFKRNNIEQIDSYEIVNKKLYDEIIEIF